MRHDPVVEEIRRHGAEIAEACGGSVHEMAERFRREQKQHPERVQRREIKRANGGTRNSASEPAS